MVPTNKFWVQVDFNSIPVRNLVIEGSPEPPANPVTGMLWVDTTDPANAVLHYFDGDEWVELGPAIPVEGPPGPPGPQGPPGGAYVTATWQYQTNTSPPPQSGALRTNATQDTAYLSKTDDNGIDRSAGLASLEDGDTLFINPLTGAGRSEILISGSVTDSGDYVTFPYTIVSGTPDASKATEVEISLVHEPEPGPPGPPGPPGNANVIFSPTAPTDPQIGDIWWQSPE